MRKIITDEYRAGGFYLPKFYAVAYRHEDMAAYVLYPIGIHWIVRWWRSLYRWCRFSWKPDRWERVLEEEYKKGAIQARDNFIERLHHMGHHYAAYHIKLFHGLDRDLRWSEERAPKCRPLENEDAAEYRKRVWDSLMELDSEMMGGLMS